MYLNVSDHWLTSCLFLTPLITRNPVQLTEISPRMQNVRLGPFSPHGDVSCESMQKQALELEEHSYQKDVWGVLKTVCVVFFFYSNATKRKHGIHRTAPSQQGKKCDPVPPHTNARAPLWKGKIWHGEQETQKHKHHQCRVSMRGKHHPYKEKWLMHKSPIVSMYWRPRAKRKKRKGKKKGQEGLETPTKSTHYQWQRA